MERHGRVGGLLATAIFMVLCLRAHGVEYRVDSSVYVVGETEPHSRHQTWFTDTATYDVQKTPERRVTIVDVASGGLTLIDESARRVCRIAHDDLVRIVAAMIERSSDKPEVVQFAAAPEFRVEWDGEHLRMPAEPIAYDVVTVRARQEGAASAYRQFADAIARLNASQPWGLPPNARLEVNREVAVQDRLQGRVEVARVDFPATLYSTHSYRWKFSDADRAEIERLRGLATDFEEVNLVAFYERPERGGGHRR